MRLDNIAKANSLDLAIEATDSKLLEELSKSFNPNVRRAVAKNRHTSANTLFELAYDCVLNVSYLAVKNPNCTVNREINVNHPCVACDLDERSINCMTCTKVTNLYN